MRTLGLYHQISLCPVSSELKINTSSSSFSTWIVFDFWPFVSSNNTDLCSNGEFKNEPMHQYNKILV